jgi:hypothetical protein
MDRSRLILSFLLAMPAASLAYAHDMNRDGSEDARDCLEYALAQFRAGTAPVIHLLEPGSYNLTTSTDWWSYAVSSTPADHCRQYTYFIVSNPYSYSTLTTANWNPANGNAEWCSHSVIDYAVFSSRGGSWYVAGGGQKWGAPESRPEMYYGACSYDVRNLGVRIGLNEIYIASENPGACGDSASHVDHIVAIKNWGHNHNKATTDCGQESCYYPTLGVLYAADTSGSCGPDEPPPPTDPEPDGPGEPIGTCSCICVAGELEEPLGPVQTTEAVCLSPVSVGVFCSLGEIPLIPGGETECTWSP